MMNNLDADWRTAFKINWVIPVSFSAVSYSISDWLHSRLSSNRFLSQKIFLNGPIIKTPTPQILLQWEESAKRINSSISKNIFNRQNHSCSLRGLWAMHCEICSNLTTTKRKWCQWRCSGVFIVNFEHILLFLSLTLSRQILLGFLYVYRNDARASSKGDQIEKMINNFAQYSLHKINSFSSNLLVTKFS